MPEDLKDLTRRFLAHRHQLLGFIHGLVRDLDAAEEILQEVWIRLADAVERDVDIRQPEAWCRGTAKNLVLHYFRSKRTAKVTADSRFLDLAEQAFAEAEQGPSLWTTRREAVFRCVETLPDKSREIVRMKYVEGLKVAEIARRKGRSIDAVMKALSRIRQVLGECVERRRLGEDGLGLLAEGPAGS
ncbi:sigma-70 family RNA polymerase sigma factor [Humisphaera borealis]|uniref:Sigma-70 family RNA polymerase sigma factor n=1 Tax=Humisphaera borealis TaxID=2807512 RepID=A0A7M2WTG3_9BACT|nr:sigma-70 family RNA polymerase sigma factor [Humisphaera borealis]QOV88807.1 sigma-70 family RNA polymerase sigma factor [Humisphaera borealis]